MKTLKVKVANKIATYEKAGGLIVCGNNDYQIEFEFDSDWDAYNEKTARFICGGRYQDVSFEGNICPVPVIVKSGLVEVGVYVADMRTSTGAKIGCYPSILCESSGKENQFPTLHDGKSCFVRYSENADGADYTEEWREGQNYIGIATSITEPTDKSGYTWSKFVADKLYKVNAYISGFFDAYHSGASDTVEFQLYVRTQKTIESKAPSVEAFLQSCRCGQHSVDSKENAVPVSGYISNYYDQYSDIPIKFYCTQTEDGYTFYIDWEGQHGGEYTVSWYVSPDEVGKYITIEKEAV